jgi:hypothetical protein
MSEASGQYTIKIKTEKEGDGAEKTADSLKDVAQHAEKGAEGMKLFGKHSHEAHAALRLLNDTIPGFEQMARFLSNSLTATMGVGALAITFLKGKIDDMNKALDSLQSSPGARGEWAEKMKEKAEESAVAYDVWRDHIERLIKATQTLDQLADRSLAQERERIGTQKAIGDAEKQLAEARLQLAEKLGQVTPEQAIKIRLEIDDAAFKREAEAKAAEIQAEISARSLEKGNNELLMPQKAAAVSDAKTAADAAAAAKIKNDEKLAQDKKNLDASIEAQKKAQEIVDSLEGKGMWGGNYDKSDPQYWTLKAAREKVESEGRIQGSLKASIGQETGKQQGLDTAAATSKAAYEEAKSKYEEAVKRENELNVKLAQLTQDLAAEKAKASALENLHNQTSAANAHSQEVDVINRRIQQEEKGGFPNTPQGESDWAIGAAQNVMARARSGQAGPGEVVQTLNMVTQVLAEHVSRTEEDRQMLIDTKARLQNVQSSLAANTGQS